MSIEPASLLIAEWVSELLNLTFITYAYSYQFDGEWFRIFVIKEDHGDRIVGQVLVRHLVVHHTMALSICDPDFVSKLSDMCSR
jgi:hypothetical protein